MLYPPYVIGGKPNVERQGGDLPGLKTPLSRYASLPPCSHRGDQTARPLTWQCLQGEGRAGGRIGVSRSKRGKLMRSCEEEKGAF